MGLVITLKSVGWHEVNSCGGGFCFAAHEAMLSTQRILQVPGSSRELPTIPSRDRPQVMLVDGIAACGEMSSKPPKSSELDEQNSELSEFRHTVSRKIILLADIIPPIIIAIIII